MWCICFLLLLCPCIARHCSVDTDLNSLTEFQYDFKKIPIVPEDQVALWREWSFNMYHTFFYLFGEFQENSGNAIINVGLYDNDQAVLEVNIDCGSAGWTLKSLNSETRGLEVIGTGNLVSSCKPGMFDVIIKVEQRHKAQMLFNGEEIIHDTKPDGKTARLAFPVATSNTFKADSSNGAEFKRFAFGKCVAYPKGMKTCNEARIWTANRSKGLKGPQGAYMQVFVPKCWPGNADYWNYYDDTIHPDENSVGKTYCCCTNMRTGEIEPSYETVTKTDNQGEEYTTKEWITCKVASTFGIECKIRCRETWDYEVIAENPIQ